MDPDTIGAILIYGSIFAVICFCWIRSATKKAQRKEAERQRQQAASRSIIREIEQGCRNTSQENAVLALDLTRRFIKASYDSPTEILERFTQHGQFAAAAFLKVAHEDLPGLEWQRVEDRREAKRRAAAEAQADLLAVAAQVANNAADERNRKAIEAADRRQDEDWRRRESERGRAEHERHLTRY
ncbi:hypothetical protein [Methylobacterium nigriterrae]|uniref:hypothetical protein n=1 Tax=Methylobacterium nigriterrae TaxID=3127512 RepID=UPI0030134C39